MTSKVKNPVPISFEELVGQQAPVTGILYDVTNNTNNLNGYLVNGSCGLKDNAIFVTKEHIEERLEEIYIEVEEIMDIIETTEEEYSRMQLELEEKDNTVEDTRNAAIDFVESLIEEIVDEYKEQYPDIKELINQINVYKKQLEKELDKI